MQAVTVSRSLAALAASTAAAILLLAAGPAEAKIKTKVFSSGPIGFAIPDNAFEVRSTPPIKIKKRGKILDLNVAVRITHPDTTQLEFSIFDNNFEGGFLFEHEPKDGGIPLSPNLGAGPGDCTDAFTIFDDEAPLAVSAGVNPYLGSYVPTFDGLPTPILRDFKGKSLEGRYRLEVDDSAFGRTGAVNCWQLIVRYNSKQKGKDL
jgi:subtilisin-like proprotein convertase family protein